MTSLTVDIRKKTYANGCCAIQNLVFSATPGEFVAIVGPSGAGKTTLLNLISGLDREMDGEVGFQSGQAPTKKPRIGFLFQEPRLMPWLTVQQNLALVLPATAHPDRIGQLPDWLNRVGLPGCGAMFPGQLSGGMQRRVALLRAFIVDPELLLMDEPFQSLDAPTAAQLRRLLHELWQNSAPTVLFVTHNLREAISVASKILFLSARPSRVILEYPLTRLAQLDIESDEVSAEHKKILETYPNLLAGLYLD